MSEGAIATGRLEGIRVGPWCAVIALGLMSAWLGLVGLGALSAAGDLSGALATARAHSAGPALFAFVAVVLLAERLWPAVERPLLARAHIVDAAYLVLFAAVVLPLLTLVQTGFAVEVARHAGFLIVSRLGALPQVAVVVVILIAIDGMNWAAHLANHRSLALWRLHALHHSQEDMSVLTTFRTHPHVLASYLPALVPALLLGSSGAVPEAAVIAYACLVTLSHANQRWSFGPLARVIVSPAYHRLHHAEVPGDGGAR
jgi:sterol desaturase/sphingolipid hydroxylase (fatty acid hydroxylase superfamily)